MRLIDGLTPDLNMSVFNRLIWDHKSIDVKVVMNASSDGGYTVTKNGSTIDRVRYRGLVRRRFINRPSPEVWM